MNDTAFHTAPLYGLVVCGGQSSRMGTDKSLLQYHALPQRYHVYHLLEQVCERVFLSCNEHQADNIPPGYSFLTDMPVFAEHGPVSALLTAFHHFPGAAFLVLGCDYPFLAIEQIRPLADKRNPQQQAIAFFRDEPSFPEPMLALYEPSIQPLLTAQYRQGNDSLSRLLRIAGALLLPAIPKEAYESVDTPEAYRLALQRLAQSR